MNIFYRVAAACLIALFSHPAAWAGFADPLDSPSVYSALASRAQVNALAMAGNRVLAAGQRGHVLYSDNGGAAWQQANVPVSSDLTAIFFADRATGWAVGHDSVILRTADGGASWQRRFDGRRDPEAGDKPLLDIRVDANGQGLAVGAFGLALRTTDGGQSWRHAEDLLDNPKGMHLNAIRAIGDDLVIVGEQGLVLRRAAGSERFTALPTPYQGSFFGAAGDASRLLVFGLRGTALLSTDGGRSWTRSDTGTQAALVAGAVLQDGSLLLVSQSGQVLRSTDNGATFRVQPGAAAGPATAALPLPNGGLLIGGARGLRTHTLALAR